MHFFAIFIGNVCDYISCHECNHRRCIYSNKLFSVAEKALLKIAKEDILYSCGMQFVTSVTVGACKGGSKLSVSNRSPVLFR